MNETNDYDPGPAATTLAEAWRSGTLLTELPAAIRPRTLMQGYDVQDRLIAELGGSFVGWKLGVGSPVQKRQSGVGRAIAGRILASRVYRDGETILLPNAAPVTIEFEIAYVLKRDVLPDEMTIPVFEAVGEVRSAFELVLSRFIDRRAVGWPSFAADNAAFQAFVLGEVIDRGRIGELGESLVISSNGNEAARSLSGEEATDPEAALADLMAIARERGVVLPKGSIVSTGTVSKPFQIAAPAAEVRARFGDTELGFRTRVVQISSDVSML